MKERARMNQPPTFILVLPFPLLLLLLQLGLTHQAVELTRTCTPSAMMPKNMFGGGGSHSGHSHACWDCASCHSASTSIEVQHSLEVTYFSGGAHTPWLCGQKALL